MFLYIFVLHQKKSEDLPETSAGGTDGAPTWNQTENKAQVVTAKLNSAGAGWFTSTAPKLQHKKQGQKVQNEKLVHKTSVVQSGGARRASSWIMEHNSIDRSQKNTVSRSASCREALTAICSCSFTIKIQRRPADRLRWASPSAQK